VEKEPAATVGGTWKHKNEQTLEDFVIRIKYNLGDLMNLMKKIILVCALALACSFTAKAQADYSKVDVFGGYSYLRLNLPGAGFNANGGSGQITYNFNSMIGLTGDFGGYHVSAGNFNGSGTVFSYLFGPKFTYRTGRFSPFAQALFGGAWLGSGISENCDASIRPQGGVTCGANTSLNSFAMALGGGADYKFSDHVSFRLVDLDYFMTRFNVGSVVGTTNHTQSNIRVSTGVVFNF
jgi:opacity protein-like surface antigen